MGMRAVQYRLFPFLHLYLAGFHIKLFVAFTARILNVLYALELFTVAVSAFITG